MVGIAVAFGVIWVWANRDDPLYAAPVLPTPDPAVAAMRTDATAPSVEAAGEPTSAAPDVPDATDEDPGATGLAPWDVPPVDLSTGAPLAVDYTAGRARPSTTPRSSSPPPGRSWSDGRWASW